MIINYLNILYAMTSVAVVPSGSGNKEGKDKNELNPRFATLLQLIDFLTDVGACIEIYISMDLCEGIYSRHFCRCQI